MRSSTLNLSASTEYKKLRSQELLNFPQDTQEIFFDLRINKINTMFSSSIANKNEIEIIGFLSQIT